MAGLAPAISFGAEIPPLLDTIPLERHLLWQRGKCPTIQWISVIELRRCVTPHPPYLPDRGVPSLGATGTGKERMKL